MQLFKSRTAIELALVQVAMNLQSGIYLPFVPVWFASKGFDPSMIGYALALSMVLRSASGPIAGLIADAFDDRRAVILVCASLSLICWAVAGFNSWVALVFAFAVLGNVTYTPSGAIVESLTIRLAQSEGFSYGRVRLCGSIAFIVANVLAGYAAAQYGIAIFLPLMLAVIAFTILAAAILPRGNLAKEGPSQFSPSFTRTWRQAKQLASHRTFIVFLAAVSLVQASHGFYYGYFTLTYDAAGVSKGTIGWLWGIGVSAEVVLFAFAQRAFTHLGAVKLIAIGAVGAVIRWTIFAFVPPVSLLLVLQLLHGASFGATHLGTMLFLLRAAPANLSATAQSFYGVVGYGLMMALSTLLSGSLYESVGSYGFLAMSGLALSGLGFALILGRIWHGGLLDLGETMPQYAAPLSSSERAP